MEDANYTQVNNNNLLLSNTGKNILYHMNGDMKFVGVFSIVIGIINCLTIFGAIIGVPVLLMGLRLKDAADNFNHYLQSDTPAYFEMGLEKQRSYFFIMKVMIIITLVIIAVEIIALVFLFSYIMQNFSEIKHSV